MVWYGEFQYTDLSFILLYNVKQRSKYTWYGMVSFNTPI